VSELQDMLRVQARLHRKQGANALGDLFQSAALEIEILTERLENPQGLQELICVEQMKEISLPEIHRANQKLHEQLAKANERVREFEKELKESEDDLDAAEKQLSSYENALEEVQAVFVDSDACPLFEPFNPRNLSAWLNKFAIEKKLKALNDLLEEIQCSVVVPKRYEQLQEPYLEGIKHCIQFIECQSEQLRKEQENG
jgi:septal ring factor EnvC (AmiA/AmiB activator)